MKKGLNSNWARNYDCPKYFVDLAKHMRHWSGDLIQFYGQAYPSDINEVCVANLVDINAGVLVESGTYHVTWSGIGILSVGDSASYRDGESFTIEYAGNKPLNANFSGKQLSSLSVIHEDYISQISEWHPAYIDYIKSMGDNTVTVMRSMNWTQASETYESEWDDRVTQDNISYHMGVPLETIIDFSNQTGIDMWWCIPPRATDEYVSEAAKLIKAQLWGHLYLELGNEIWNTGSPWGDSTAWINNYSMERETADIVNTSTFECSGKAHGLTTGQEIVLYGSLHDKQNDIKVPWQFTNGMTVTVTVINDSLFTLFYNGDLLRANEEQTEIIYSLKGGKLNENYSNVSEKFWDIFDSAGITSITRVIASQYNNPWLTQERYRFINDKTRIGAIAIAPYYHIDDVIVRSFSDMAKLERMTFPVRIDEHFIDDIPIVCYEGGPHYSMRLSEEIESWLYEYWKSDECEAVISEYLQLLDRESIQLFCYYKDASITRFGLTTDMNNPKSDGRYRGFVNGDDDEPPVIPKPKKIKIKISGVFEIEFID